MAEPCDERELRASSFREFELIGRNPVITDVRPQRDHAVEFP